MEISTIPFNNNKNIEKYAIIFFNKQNLGD